MSKDIEYKDIPRVFSLVDEESKINFLGKLGIKE